MNSQRTNFVTSDTTEIPVREINLTFCKIQLFDGWVWTQFPDGSGYGAYPHDTPEYREVANRLGYDCTMAYCFEHEFCHSFVAQEIIGSPSPVLWALAHHRRHPDITVFEEALVQAFQAYLKGVAPMSAVAPDVDWYCLVRNAQSLLELG